jgi:lipoprotein-anchoring transpeptidase ErfK/SrfK
MVVSIPDRKLALLEDGQVIKVYPVAVGAPSSPSPAGEFRIIHRITKPTYYTPGKVIPPGKSNPLGTRWLGLSLKGFGIHGTNAPRSIGKNQSHGCIRLKNADVEELFRRVEVGDPVEIHEQENDRVAAIFSNPEQPSHSPETQSAIQVAAVLDVRSHR